MEQIGILEMIDNILTQNKFNRLVQVEKQCENIGGSGRLYVQHTTEVIQYLLVIEISKEDLLNSKKFLSEGQMDIYHTLQGSVHEATFDKNVSLLLCLEYKENDDFEKINQYILRIEEDPYCFKKLVLFYTRHEIETISSILESEKCSIWNLIQSKFEKYKLIDVEDEKTNFISKLCIKLPFIPITFSDNQEFNNIQSKIQMRIKEKNLEEIWKRIDTYNLGEYTNLKLLIDKEELDDVLNSWYIKTGE